MTKLLKVFFVFFIATASISHYNPAAAFSLPERLTFDLTWAGIKAGSAVLEATDNGDTISFSSRAVSADWISVFYPVEDTAVSSLKKTAAFKSTDDFIGIPHTYRLKTSEGRHKKNRETIFDQDAQKAVYTDFLSSEKVSAELHGITFDPLSAFFYVRKLPLEVGKSVYVEIYDSKKLYSVEVQVLKKEVLETPLGKFKTVLIKPVMKSDGIFYRKGDILISFTDDARRLPVMVRTKVPVGYINVILVSAK